MQKSALYERKSHLSKIKVAFCTHFLRLTRENLAQSAKFSFWNKSIIRSTLDYASVTYHSMLTGEHNKEIERLQRTCLRIIFGWDKPYEVLLEENALETLDIRRKRMTLNFAHKCTERHIFRDWFPIEKEKEHDLRATRKYA